MSDALADATAELYRMPPEEFVTARDERVKALRKDGDAATAKQVAALRKPTVGAWVVNLLVADEPELTEQVTALADQLRAAQEKLAGEDLRALGRQRQELVAGLVARARGLARDAGRQVGGNVLDTEVESSLRAALADPDVAREVLSGRLTHAAEFTGFGPAAPAPAVPEVHDREGKRTRKATDSPHDHGRGRAKGASKRGEPKESAAERRRAAQRENALERLRKAEETLETAQAEHDAAQADKATAADQLASARERADRVQVQLEEAQAELDRVVDVDEQARWRTKRAAAALKAAEASVGKARDRANRSGR